MSYGQYILINGKIQPSEQSCISTENRSFRYGDGLFETIRIVNSKPCFVKNHFNRLVAGMKQLKMDIPKEFSAEFIEKKLLELVKENDLVGGGVARLSVFRDQGTTYVPLSNTVSYIVDLRPLDNNYFELNNEGLNIGIFSEIKKPKDPFSLFKTSNALLYVMAAIHAKENNYDDCFLMNKNNELIETTSSNIFIVSNRILYTPSLENGCVAGTMRMNIINLAIENKIKVYECSITHRNLLLADEIFLTNAVRGLQWVKSYQENRYYNSLSKFLIEKLNQSVASLVKDPQENWQ